VALRPVEIRGPPVLSTHSVHTVAQQHSEETKGPGFGSPDPAITWRPIRAQRELNKEPTPQWRSWRGRPT
jgi:hypothetical protein